MAMKYFADLKTGNNDGIKVKCRCESKSEPHHFNNNGVINMVTNFSFYDGKGFMNASCYDPNIVNKISEKNTYIIGKIFVKFNQYNNNNEMKLNKITEIDDVSLKETLEGELKDICPSIEYAVQHHEIKAVAGVCTSITKFNNCTKYRLADSSGSIDTTVFKSEKEIKEGDIVILINFNRDKYRGGDVFRAGDETKILLNDDTYQFTIDNANFECTEYLKMWYQNNNCENSLGPNFSEYKEEKKNELSVEGVKRKYPEIENDVNEEWEDLLEEIRRTDVYLQKLERKKARMELERKMLLQK